jgi:NAD+ diphosphatase
MDDLRQMLATMSPGEFRAAARERELEEWRSINRFCGKCAAPMKLHANSAERALICSKCGYTAYPKLSPAVIVLVTKGNKILLQRNTHYKLRNWTLVAGFVDAGENFEDAVRREVMEEASIEIKDLRYFGSQTWPFPSNIMVGFRAEYAAGELAPDGEEVVESGWFDCDNLPEIPHKGSIARQMIDEWLQEQDEVKRGV